MQDKVPLSWIEDAEAKQVLAAALFEQAPAPSWRKAGCELVAYWLPRVRSWLAPAPTGWSRPQLELQPALIRRAPCHRVRRESDERLYSCEW